MTGPTGSGKTTTLYACLNEINSPKIKIITIEDPVEYEMEGITQIQVNSRVNFDFAKGLRSLLRHDPDIIMVGEVRDLETAEIAIRTALTGHLVFSTLHTNDASSGMTRLIDMGVEPYLVASSVESFVAQRLVRIICPKCKEEDSSVLSAVKDEIYRSLSLSSQTQITIYRGKGCEYCNNTGYYGRNAIYEILQLNDMIRAAILEKPRSDYIKRIAIREGLITLRQNGWQDVMDGITTPDEVMNVTIKDEILEEKFISTAGMLDASAFHLEKTETRGEETFESSQRLGHTTEYETRIHPRAYASICLKFRQVKNDPENKDRLIPDGIEHQTVCENISAGGVCFCSQFMIPVDSLVELCFKLDDHEASIHCLAKVCRLKEDCLNQRFSIVTSFLNLSISDRTKIKEFINKRLKEEELNAQSQ